MNHGESEISFIFASSFCILKRQLAWRNARGKQGTGQNPAQPGTLHTIFVQPHIASRCSIYLCQWIFEKFGSWISYKLHSPTPTFLQVRPQTHSSSSRRVKTAALLQLNCDPSLSTWAIRSRADVACTWTHMLKQIVSVSLLQRPFIQTLQTVHLVSSHCKESHWVQ